MASVEKNAEYVTLKQTENRQWALLGAFSVLACVAIAITIYNFSSRISVLEEKTNNLQKTIELYEQKNKEIKQEYEKYFKTMVDSKNAVAMYEISNGGFYE
jgi:Tfp pilus assembly protein PilN